MGPLTPISTFPSLNAADRVVVPLRCKVLAEFDAVLVAGGLVGVGILALERDNRLVPLGLFPPLSERRQFKRSRLEDPGGGDEVVRQGRRNLGVVQHRPLPLSRVREQLQPPPQLEKVLRLGRVVVLGLHVVLAAAPFLLEHVLLGGGLGAVEHSGGFNAALECLGAQRPGVVRRGFLLALRLRLGVNDLAILVERSGFIEANLEVIVGQEVGNDALRHALDLLAGFLVDLDHIAGHPRDDGRGMVSGFGDADCDLLSLGHALERHRLDNPLVKVVVLAELDFRQLKLVTVGEDFSCQPERLVDLAHRALLLGRKALGLTVLALLERRRLDLGFEHRSVQAFPQRQVEQAADELHLRVHKLHGLAAHGVHPLEDGGAAQSGDHFAKERHRLLFRAVLLLVLLLRSRALRALRRVRCCGRRRRRTVRTVLILGTVGRGWGAAVTVALLDVCVGGKVGRHRLGAPPAFHKRCLRRIDEAQ
mmetsp:Transcript_35962/g.94299  ORF Transcript_35962/g.94299 Transcript_35962/m.94299 type:complete len:478 (-) Transcript_35962:290-1723(-)